MINNLLFTFLILTFGHMTMAQCSAPSSATVTASPAVCQGQGQVIALVSNPPAGAVYQYQLQYDSTSNTSVVKPWQVSDTFNQVSVGRYKVYIRQVCGASFSSVYVSASVAVGGTTASLSITQASAMNKSACGNGKLSVTATGGNTSLPYRYALVPTLNEPEPVVNYVRPKQSSNIFSGLSAGTYYARVYDTCGTYASATVVIDSVTENVALTTSRNNYVFYACDSFRFVYSVSPNTRLQTGAPDSAERFWVRYNGVTDTLTYPANVGSYSLSGSAYKTDINKRIKPIAYPAQIAYGYKSVCGTIYEQTVTVQAPVVKLVLTSNSISCTQRRYNISVRDSLTNTAPYYNTRLSLDSGATWSALNTNTLYSDTFIVGNTYNIWVASACDTEKVAETVVLPALSVVMSPFTSYSCNGNSGFALQAVNYSGNVDSVKFNVLSKPAGSTLPDSFYLIQTSGLSGNNFGYRLSYDITPGAYSIKATDACGATQTVNKTINPTTVAFTTAPLLSCLSSQSGFRVTVTETNYQPSFAFSPIRVIVTNTATNQVDSFTNNTNITTRPVNVDVTGLTNGTYTLRVIKVRPTTGALGLPYPACSVNGTYTNTSNQPLSLTQSTFTSACTNGTATIAAQVQGGGGGNQFYVDLQAGSSWTQVAGPQSSAVFNNLLPNSIYRLRVTDACGNGTQYSTSFSNAAPAMNYSSTTAPCSGDAFTMSVAPNSAATYTWQKNSNPIAGATSNSYTLNPVPPAGSSVDTYLVKIAYGSCDVFSASYAVDPTLCNQPLPVSLISFSGSIYGTQVQLRWEVARYESVNTFEVEYSTDGKQFEKIASVPGNEDRYYQYTDEYRKASSLYYRLKMIGADGQSSYSQVIQLNGKDGADRTIQVYPTIANDKLYIRYSCAEDETLSWKIVNLQGGVVRSGTFAAGKGTTIATIGNLTGVTSGTYILSVHNSISFSHKEKIVIRK